MPETKRIFIAVDISEEARRLADGYIHGLREPFSDVRVGWERPEKMHLTLNFLGDTGTAELVSVRQIVRDVAGRNGAFRLRIDGTGVFPNQKRPRVLWLGVDGQIDAIRRIKSELDAGLSGIGFKSERKIYTPHLTIARLREPERSGAIAARHLSNEFDSPEFMVSSLTVYESRLDRHGSTYSIVDRFDLKS